MANEYGSVVTSGTDSLPCTRRMRWRDPTFSAWDSFLSTFKAAVPVLMSLSISVLASVPIFLDIRVSLKIDRTEIFSRAAPVLFLYESTILHMLLLWLQKTMQ